MNENGYPSCYDLVWDEKSADSSQSMPVGGGDVGLNVWVEDDSLLVYLGKKDCYDEWNQLLKPGRVRVRFEPDVLTGIERFRQTLVLAEGLVRIETSHPEYGNSTIEIWAEPGSPHVRIGIDTEVETRLRVRFESWRQWERELRDNEKRDRFHAFGTEGYPGRVVETTDIVEPDDTGLTFYHRNPDETLYDIEIETEELSASRDEIWNPLSRRTFGGCLFGTGLTAGVTGEGRYASVPYRFWELRSEAGARRHELSAILHTEQTETVDEWMQRPAELRRRAADYETAQGEHRQWWRRFWERSRIVINPEADESDPAWQLGRNYALFRFMLGTLSSGSEPTKFNGAVYTFDADHVDLEGVAGAGYPPDYRHWGGGSYTAQNQRLVYWPMLANGDFDAMIPQFEFYLRGLAGATARVKEYWGHEGCCFPEHPQQNGIPPGSHYGFHDSPIPMRNRPRDFERGAQYNTAIGYLYDTQLELCWMILQYHRYTGLPIVRYLPFLEGCAVFYYEHYRMRRRKTDGSDFDENGNLVIYPSNALEGHYGAINPTSAVAGLHRLIEGLLGLPDELEPPDKKALWKEIRSRIPDLAPQAVHDEDGAPQPYFQPAKNKTHGHAHSSEMYPGFPYLIYGLEGKDRSTMLNTWRFGLSERARNSTDAWVQGGVHAARLGLVEHARRWIATKMADDSPHAPYKFPAFWHSGDYPPDFNHGGVAMVALQQMLMQADDEKIHLLPCWPADWDCDFTLHAPGQTTVSASVRGGRVVHVETDPPERIKDVVAHDAG